MKEKGKKVKSIIHFHCRKDMMSLFPYGGSPNKNHSNYTTIIAFHLEIATLWIVTLVILCYTSFTLSHFSIKILINQI